MIYTIYSSYYVVYMGIVMDHITIPILKIKYLKKMGEMKIIQIMF